MKFLHSICDTASIFTPLSVPTLNASSSLSLDASSHWQTSAFQMLAIETLSLPSRLRASVTDGGSLADMEQLFTSDSTRRNILQTKLKLPRAEPHSNGITNGVNGTHQNHGSNDDTVTLFPPIRQTRSGEAHQFSKLSVSRGADEQPNGDSDTRIYSSNLKFPLLSSFPEIIKDANEDQIEIEASLSANSEVANWLRAYAAQTILLPLDEREDIKSDFLSWAEEYVDGWESDGDDWDD
jgi:hypothetical protein